MTLEHLGYNPELEQYRVENGLDSFTIGRVTAEHKERYAVRTADKEYDAEILGNLRFTAQSRADFPAVGDWVAISEYDDDKALIHAILPRNSIIERQSAGAKSDKQIIATNIDSAFIVVAVDRDFNINRIERYLAICNAANVSPIVVLTKADLVDEEQVVMMTEQVKKRIHDVPVFAISNASLQGIEALKSKIEKGKTYCLLGSSGVGKSTLLNTLSGKNLMETDVISEHTQRGRHVTTHRELQVLDGGAIIIDNPGMREVGITDSAEGLDLTFEKILELSGDCKFKDCTHTSEAGCAVLEALEDGEIDPASFENYQKMAREKAHYESTVVERRRKGKELSKILKSYKKGNYKDR